ncbi:t cell receptor beta [Limosa lapponica baueri]|nr:t cell receptor beta [Limosa lapponica baueri]
MGRRRIGAGVGSLIMQWPEATLKRAGETVDISCYQNYTTLAFMFWYQQPPRHGLKLVASITTWMKNSYEEGYSEAKFYITRDNNDYSVMTIKNVTYNDAATYFCAASDHTPQNNVNNEKLDFGSGTKLTVIEQTEKIEAPALAIFSPSKQEIQQKSKATLVCLASGFYPDHLNLFWKVNGAKRTEGVGTDEFSTQNGDTYSLTSRLRISAQEWFNPFNRFECVANFFKNGTLDSTHKFIYGDAVSYLWYGNSLKLTYLILCGKALLYAVLVSSLVWTAKDNSVLICQINKTVEKASKQTSLMEQIEGSEKDETGLKKRSQVR